jgi:cold shock CspA family protein
LSGLRLGRVAEYDADRGLGVVSSVSGESYGFHCTAIAGGSRLIDPGTRVAFVLAPGLGGVFEARQLTPV